MLSMELSLLLFWSTKCLPVVMMRVAICLPLMMWLRCTLLATLCSVRGWVLVFRIWSVGKGFLCDFMQIICWNLRFQLRFEWCSEWGIVRQDVDCADFRFCSRDLWNHYRYHRQQLWPVSQLTAMSVCFCCFFEMHFSHKQARIHATCSQGDSAASRWGRQTVARTRSTCRAFLVISTLPLTHESILQWYNSEHAWWSPDIRFRWKLPSKSTRKVEEESSAVSSTCC